jgi:hypothetical protein
MYIATALQQKARLESLKQVAVSFQNDEQLLPQNTKHPQKVITMPLNTPFTSSLASMGEVGEEEEESSPFGGSPPPPPPSSPPTAGCS